MVTFMSNKVGARAYFTCVTAPVLFPHFRRVLKRRMQMWDDDKLEEFIQEAELCDLIKMQEMVELYTYW